MTGPDASENLLPSDSQFIVHKVAVFKTASAHILLMEDDDLADQDGGRHGTTWHCPQKKTFTYSNTRAKDCFENDNVCKFSEWVMI